MFSFVKSLCSFCHCLVYLFTVRRRLYNEWSKMKDEHQKKYFNLTKFPSNDSNNLVTLISGLIHNTGLLSYTTDLKVHWIANIVTICFITTCFLQIIALLMAKNDPDRLFECFSVLAFCGMGVFKLYSLRKNHNRWRFLLTQIAMLENDQSKGYRLNADSQSEDEEADNFSKYVIIYTGKFKTTSTILQRIYNFTVVIFMVSPFLEHLLRKVHGKECSEYPHILPGWAPLDNLSIFGYLLTLTCEFIAAVYCVWVHIAFDLTSLGVMLFVSGQFSLLRDYSTRVGGNGKKNNISKKRDDRARLRIKHCHRTNIILVNSINELDKLLRNIIGVYFFVATLTLCSVAVRLKSEDMGIMKLISLLQYMCATLTQLFLFCRYGDMVLNESSIGMGQGPFGSAYWCLSPSIRREVLLLSISMMKPRHLHAGPFNYIDLPSFIQVVRTAYSYYAVIGKKE